MNVRELNRFAPRGRMDILQGIATHWSLARSIGITTPLRVCHFMAQLAHESAGFRATTEYASGAAYEGRKDLGNVKPGDGVRYKGRGLIQVTGRANYHALTIWIAQHYPSFSRDFVRKPEMVAAFPYAILSACWYWSARGLNADADRNNLRSITRKINGGYNGLADRRDWFARAKDVWGSSSMPVPSTAPTGKIAATGAAISAAGTAAAVQAGINPIAIGVGLAFTAIVGGLLIYIHKASKK